MHFQARSVSDEEAEPFCIKQRVSDHLRERQRQPVAVDVLLRVESRHRSEPDSLKLEQQVVTKVG